VVTHEQRCPNCGSDPFFTEDYSRLLTDLTTVHNVNRKLGADNGMLRAQAEVDRLIGQDYVSSLQRKIQRQKRVINRLEDRLRTLGKPPYEGDR
jgi:hypothetical protein